jgi:hypothetical protein
MNVANIPTSKSSVKLYINVSFSLRRSRDALAVVYNAYEQTSIFLSHRRGTSNTLLFRYREGVLMVRSFGQGGWSWENEPKH